MGRITKNGMMEYWNTGILVVQAEQFNISGKAQGLSPEAGFPVLPRAYASRLRPSNASLQYSIAPILQ
jgi:hypothetical protein